jgi:hypothetical protein
MSSSDKLDLAASLLREYILEQFNETPSLRSAVAGGGTMTEAQVRHFVHEPPRRPANLLRQGIAIQSIIYGVGEKDVRTPRKKRKSTSPPPSPPPEKTPQRKRNSSSPPPLHSPLSVTIPYHELAKLMANK